MGNATVEFVHAQSAWSEAHQGIRFIGTCEGETITFVASKEALQAIRENAGLPDQSEAEALFSEYERVLFAAAVVAHDRDSSAEQPIIITEDDVQQINR